MKQYQPYVDSLQRVLASAMTGSTAAQHAQIDAALDGQALMELRRLVPIAKLRGSGAFFTGSTLAKHAAGYLTGILGPNDVVVDPACGAGDLLIACANHLPIQSSLKATLRSWEKCLIGRDLHPEFVSATRLRLALLAVRRTQRRMRTIPKTDELFSSVDLGCGLAAADVLGRCSAIILNPPFTLIDAPVGTTWGAGKVNSAAVFVERCVADAQPGTKLVAILPDVLRSGSRYGKWRALIGSRTRNRRIVLLDQFDAYADVHVFILVADVTAPRKQNNCGQWEAFQQLGSATLEDKFDVSVGPVVDYRDPHCGPWHPYLVARALPAWEVVRELPRNRRFKGRVFVPPFVVVRRTSRPEDPQRAVGTIVAGKRPVAVENHLLVLRPKNGRMRECKELLQLLRSPPTTNWLNRRIRCRHLTVAAVRDLPWRKP